MQYFITRCVFFRCAFFLCFFLCFSFISSKNPLFAQKEPFKIGGVTEEEVRMTNYEKDKNAPAVILYEYGAYEHKVDTKENYIKGFLSVKKRIKIFSDTKYATVLLYVRNNARLEDVEGYAYNWENGKIQKSKMEKNAIFKKKYNQYWDEFKFLIPNVKAGTVIEYAYTEAGTYYQHIPTWYFQHGIPTIWSEYRTALCGISDFIIGTKVENPFHIKETKTSSNGLRVRNTKDELVEGTVLHRWVQKDVPAFVIEQFMTCEEDYLSKVYFYPNEVVYANQSLNQTFMPSWEKLIERLLQDNEFGGLIHQKEQFSDIILPLIKDKNTPKEKMIAIFEYVKNNFKCENEHGNYNIFAEKNITELLQSKKGNTQEINLLLIGLLKEANLDANPIITSTRNNGAVEPELKSTAQFNYVAVFVEITPTENYLLDATESYYQIDIINQNALNNLALLVKPQSQYKWLQLQKRNAIKSSSIHIENITLSKENDTFWKESTVKFSGYNATYVRKYVNDSQKNNIYDSTKYYKFKNFHKIEPTLAGTMESVSKERAQINGDIVYITPMLDYTQKINPFKQENRKLQIDFIHPYETAQYMTFTIPEMYKIEELPKNLKTKTNDESVKFEFLVQKMGENKIQVINKIQINRAKFLPEEYQMLKDFYAQIVAKHQEQIVLKKK